MQDLAEIERHISHLSDRELGRLLLVNARDYTPEALEIAGSVAERRQLSLDMLKALLAAPEPPEPPEQVQTLRRPRIVGWLLFPAIGLVINPFLILNDLVQTLTQQTDIPLMTILGAVDVALLLFCCVVAWRFFGRRRDAPLLYISFNIAACALTLLCGLFILLRYEVQHFSLWNYVRSTFIPAVIWIPYFILSKRVKATFVFD